MNMKILLSLLLGVLLVSCDDEDSAMPMCVSSDPDVDLVFFQEEDITPPQVAIRVESSDRDFEGDSFLASGRLGFRIQDTILVRVVGVDTESGTRAMFISTSYDIDCQDENGNEFTRRRDNTQLTGLIPSFQRPECVEVQKTLLFAISELPTLCDESFVRGTYTLTNKIVNWNDDTTTINVQLDLF